MKRAMWRVVVVLGLLGASTFAAEPAHASEVSGGSIAFEGEASLPTFPCAAPEPGQFPCEGTFSGTVQGAFSGVQDMGGQDIPWAVELRSSQLDVSFTYFDSIDPGATCFEGAARATGTVTATGSNEAFGAYFDAPIPSAVVGATTEFDFSWYRVGTTANMKFNSLTVKLELLTGSDEFPRVVTVIDDAKEGVAGVPSTSNAPGFGAAGFVPNPEQFQDRLPACEGDPDAVGPLTATVAGSVDFAIAAT